MHQGFKVASTITNIFGTLELQCDPKPFSFPIAVLIGRCFQHPALSSLQERKPYSTTLFQVSITYRKTQLLSQQEFRNGYQTPEIAILVYRVARLRVSGAGTVTLGKRKLQYEKSSTHQCSSNPPSPLLPHEHLL